MAKRKSLIDTATDKLTEEEFDALTGQHFQSGVETGRADAIRRTCGVLEEKAGQAFIQRKNEKSQWLLELADEVRKIK